jgi:hypothetical protein
LSFFDEADEPRPTQQAPRRRRPAPSGRRGGGGSGSSGGSRTGGSGRRPPSDQQAIQVRRLIAAVAVVVILIVIVLGVHSCQVSARNSSLKDYNNNVSSIIQQSDQTGSQLFSQLSGGGGGNPTTLQNQINETRVAADNQLARAKALDVPDEMRPAHQNLLLALQMRRDGIASIATQIQPALGKATNHDALNAIAADMARFYASDVVYKGYTTTLIANALHNAGIGVGGTNGVTIEAGQFLPDIGWLTPAFIAGKIGTQVTTANGKPAPGTHGHSLDSVSVSGTQLQSGSTNTLQSNPAPTFTLNFTNSGQNNEHNVICKVSVSGSGGASVSGQQVVPLTTAGQSGSCNVQLSSSPAAGSATVTATISPVPGEKNTANNTLSFPVTFQ